MRIHDDQHFLAVNFDQTLSEYHVAFRREAELHKIAWDGTTRISPVWPIYFSNSASHPAKNNKFLGRKLSEDSYVCFLGPASPPEFFNTLQTSLLTSLKPGDAWFSLGYYNFILLLQNENETSAVFDFCADSKCHAEIWSVLDQSSIGHIRCDSIEYYNVPNSEHDVEESHIPIIPTGSIDDVKSSIDATIKQAFYEFHALRQVCKFRSGSRLQPFVKDVTMISKYVPTVDAILAMQESVAGGDPGANPEKNNIAALTHRDQILGVNAGLSRQISQALSGTPPLIQTECQFWPHSLLGTATANLALRNLASFIMGCVNRSNYSYNYQEFFASPLADNIDGAEKPFVPSGKISKYNEFSLNSESPASGEDEYVVPNPITYFSGRDGFRYGVFTNSAPLLSITGCNSKQWNLATISHELSHRVISPKIQHLFILLREWVTTQGDAELKKLSLAETTTVSEATMTLLSNAITMLEGLRLGAERFDSAVAEPIHFIYNGILQNEHELEEKLVHSFDFYHFFNQDSSRYVSSIWQSWAVQPSIAVKFEKYVERTAVALAIKHIGSANWCELAYEDFLQASCKGHFWHQTIYREKLERHLVKNRNLVEKMIRRNWAIIALFYLIFRSKRLAELVERETRDAKDAKALSLYDVSGLHFPKFTNPLKVAREYGDGKVPDSAKSAWLLSLLAYGFENGDTVAGGQ